MVHRAIEVSQVVIASLGCTVPKVKDVHVKSHSQIQDYFPIDSIVLLPHIKYETAVMLCGTMRNLFLLVKNPYVSKCGWLGGLRLVQLFSV